MNFEWARLPYQEACIARPRSRATPKREGMVGHLFQLVEVLHRANLDDMGCISWHELFRLHLDLLGRPILVVFADRHHTRHNPDVQYHL